MAKESTFYPLALFYVSSFSYYKSYPLPATIIIMKPSKIHRIYITYKYLYYNLSHKIYSSFNISYFFKFLFLFSIIKQRCPVSFNPSNFAAFFSYPIFCRYFHIISRFSLPEILYPPQMRPCTLRWIRFPGIFAPFLLCAFRFLPLSVIILCSRYLIHRICFPLLYPLGALWHKENLYGRKHNPQILNDTRMRNIH